VSGWEEFGIVVGGSIAAAMILGGTHWIWRRAHRPILEIECGEGFDFQKRVGNTDAAVALSVEEHRVALALALFIRVRETRGRSGASSVVARIKDVDPPSPATSSAVELKWADSQDTNDIQPHGYKNAFLLLVIFYVTAKGEWGWRTAPLVLDHAPELEFAIELLVDGKKYSKGRYRLKNTWETAQIQAWPESSEWPPGEITYPSIEKVAP
jgi:hypothetical protein